MEIINVAELVWRGGKAPYFLMHTVHVSGREVPLYNLFIINNNYYYYLYLKIIHTLPEKHTRKARNQGTTQNSHNVTAHVLLEVLM